MPSQDQASPAPLPDHIAHSQLVLTIATGAMSFLATLLVLLRLVSRTVNKMGVKSDDWFGVGALVCSYSVLITTVVDAVVSRAGYHIAQYDDATLGTYLQIVLTNSVLYTTSISLAKGSILLFYRRIF
ncbi:uncharacterized protein BJX67DRAFT_382011 [Aspergillus lucknowensis]|uniref:Rhodopsin domain-containing protein n=1 Tax=Aspergillus lucknowensis TaxID=176173 RepID=A0ABR4LNT3_9EURO